MNNLDSSPANTDANTGKLHIPEMPHPANLDSKPPTDAPQNTQTTPHDTSNAPHGTSNVPHAKTHNPYHSSPRCPAFSPMLDISKLIVLNIHQAF